MENKAHALMAGIFTIVLLIAAALIAMWFNQDREERIPYEIATNLSVPGLNPQAAVRYRGLDVGRVDEVLFDPEKPGRILIRFSVSKNTPITRSTFATLNYQGVTGLAYVQLDDTGRDGTLLPSSKNKVARIDMRPSLLDTLQLRGLAILRQTEEVAQKLNTFLSDENQKKMLAAFTDVSEAADKIATIPDKLQPALDEFPALTRNANEMVVSVNKLSQDANVLTNNLNEFTTRLNAPDGPLAGFSGAVDNVGSAASVIEYEAVPLINEAKTSLRVLNRTLETFNQRPQSILFGSGTPQPGPGEPGFRAP
ncbi:MlaD family protein [uncultured Oxalicibacterium sp.]|uniref:MlaD family protein n=1 Tax=uncultured Oxalicibacterium sp. TaxID=1168540 RepID=UPI0025E175F3|nr:MlaD family protein [uncultured Oxalicibacterium sp.]